MRYFHRRRVSPVEAGDRVCTGNGWAGEVASPAMINAGWSMLQAAEVMDWTVRDVGSRYCCKVH